MTTFFFCKCASFRKLPKTITMASFLMLSSLAAGVLAGAEMNEDGTGTISFQTPNLNDEETHSLHLPENLMCDACTAIAYQLTTKLNAAHEKRKSLKRLPESEVYRIVEDVCADKFEQYGIKEINKVKHLSGPGLPGESTPGIMQGGGRWPDRMQRTCYKFVEEIDEDQIYEAYLEDRDGIQALLCKNDLVPNLTDVCREKKSRSSKSKRNTKKHEL